MKKSFTNNINISHCTAKAHLQDGVVLVIVMIIVAVLGISAAVVMRSTTENLARVGRYQDYVQARELLNMGREWSSLILFQDLVNEKKNNREFDNFEDAWAEDIASPIEGEQQDMAMEIKIEDAQARFNVNNLLPVVDQNELWFKGFIRMLISLDLNPDEAQLLAEALRDWLDDDDDVNGLGGAEDGEYYRKETPYRTGNDLLSSIGELSLIHGFTPEIIELITPYVSALPLPNSEAIKLNINTAHEKLFTVVINTGFEDTEITQIFDNLPPPQTPQDTGEDSDEKTDFLPELGGDNAPEITIPGDELINPAEPEEEVDDSHENSKGARFEDGKSRSLKQIVTSLFPDRANALQDTMYDVKTEYFIVTIQVKIDDVQIKEKIVVSRILKNAGARNLSTNLGNTRKDIIKYVETSRIL